MCTLIILYKILNEYPIIALHNRYAPKETSEYPPTKIRIYNDVYCPLDLGSNGSWIGFNNKGLFMAITDQHTENWWVSRRSRGKLLLDILGTYEKVDDAFNYLHNELRKRIYKKSNFILADFNKGFHIIYDDDIHVFRLEQGPYVVTNLTLLSDVKYDNSIKIIYEKASKRHERGLYLAKKIIGTDIETVMNELKKIASDHAYGYSENSICYHDGYGWIMSSSTIVAVSKIINKSKILYSRGNPCKEKFVDYSYIINDTDEIYLKSTKLLGKKIALCLTGSVATIKSPILARELRRLGANVVSFMTENSIKYGVSSYVMEWATGNPVITELSGKAEHINNYDLVIIYPATANTINKIACGIGDNAVTTLCISTPPNKLVIAPAMNMKLYNNPVLHENINKLKKLGVTIVEPKFDEGAAKVADIDEVIDYSIRSLSYSKLKERKILILAGPTKYDIDVVRYISNKSTGKLGYYLSREAFRRGCYVRVIYGPGIVNFPRHIDVINVNTTEDMLSHTISSLKEGFDIAIFSAAILDFKPSKQFKEKIRSGKSLTIKLVPTPKVIDVVKKEFKDVFLVAFKLEYNLDKEELINRAKDEMIKVNADIIVANDIKKIQGEYHEAILLTKDDEIIEYKGNKLGLADKILDLIEEKI